MLADSDRRGTAGTARPDCVITVLPARAGLGPAEHLALRALAGAGLIPPLRPPAPVPPATRGAAPSMSAAAPGRLADPDTRHTRHTRPAVTTRPGTRRVKTRPSVGDSVETALTLH
jgi:hypothetical protein